MTCVFNCPLEEGGQHLDHWGGQGQGSDSNSPVGIQPCSVAVISFREEVRLEAISEKRSLLGSLQPPGVPRPTMLDRCL